MTKNKTITLPEGTYKLTKTKAIDPTSWVIVEGMYVIGKYAPEVTVGRRFTGEGRGLSDYITTSLVKDFKLLRNNKVEIETQNSIYILEEITNPLT